MISFSFALNNSRFTEDAALSVSGSFRATDLLLVVDTDASSVTGALQFKTDECTL